jgi:hypothetical protein
MTLTQMILRQGSSPGRCAQGIGDSVGHLRQEALRDTSDIAKMVMAQIHHVMDDESVRRVAADTISLYPEPGPPHDGR